MIGKLTFGAAPLGFSQVEKVNHSLIWFSSKVDTVEIRLN